MSQPAFRFAPSPNGRLHLGHAYSALFTDYWAKKLGGRFLLRIEDTDPTRSRPELVDGIFEDLAWLGLELGRTRLASSRSAFRSMPIMRTACERLVCSIPASVRGAPLPPYRRASIPMAHRSIPAPAAISIPGSSASASRKATDVQFRLDGEKAIAMAGPLTFTVAAPTPEDRPQIRYARPERWGDVVIQRKGTPTSYHLSVVVDDGAQGITHVTRGRDMEASTDIHVLLQFLLGLASPVYTFHKLILDDEGKKLAKSKGSQALADLRTKGVTPAQIREILGFA